MRETAANHAAREWAAGVHWPTPVASYCGALWAQREKRMTSTLIRAPWIIGFQEGEHRIMRDGCIVVDGADIVLSDRTMQARPT